MKYRVYMQQTVSSCVDVEADSADSALEKVYDSEDMPGSMVHGAFGSASVDEAGEWEPYAVYDEDNNEVWKEDKIS